MAYENMGMGDKIAILVNVMLKANDKGQENLLEYAEAIASLEKYERKPMLNIVTGKP